MKDFLFIYFSHLPGPEFFFRSIENCGYSCDFVTEKYVHEFVPNNEYKVVICYLHEHPYVSHVNRILRHPHLSKTFMVQHDDSDFEHVQVYYSKRPQLVIQRELTTESNSPFDAALEPMHFSFPSIYNVELQKKDIDISFIGRQTNPRRETFINYIMHLSKNDLRHFNWFIDNGNCRNHGEFVRITNQSKICLHFPGNSQDSIRIWELASANTCLLMPPNNLLSLSDKHMPLKNYVKYNEDMHDLKDILTYYLAENRYEYVARMLRDEYNEYHTPKRCFEAYYQQILNHAPVEKKPCIPVECDDIYRRFWNEEEAYWKDKR